MNEMNADWRVEKSTKVEHAGTVRPYWSVVFLVFHVILFHFSCLFALSDDGFISICLDTLFKRLKLHSSGLFVSRCFHKIWTHKFINIFGCKYY